MLKIFSNLVISQRTPKTSTSEKGISSFSVDQKFAKLVNNLAQTPVIRFQKMSKADINAAEKKKRDIFTEKGVGSQKKAEYIVLIDALSKDITEIGKESIIQYVQSSSVESIFRELPEALPIPVYEVLNTEYHVLLSELSNTVLELGHKADPDKPITDQTNLHKSTSASAKDGGDEQWAEITITTRPIKQLAGQQYSIPAGMRSFYNVLITDTMFALEAKQHLYKIIDNDIIKSITSLVEEKIQLLLQGEVKQDEAIKQEKVTELQDIVKDCKKKAEQIKEFAKDKVHFHIAKNMAIIGAILNRPYKKIMRSAYQGRSRELYHWLLKAAKTENCPEFQVWAEAFNSIIQDWIDLGPVVTIHCGSVKPEAILGHTYQTSHHNTNTDEDYELTLTTPTETDPEPTLTTPTLTIATETDNQNRQEIDSKDTLSAPATIPSPKNTPLESTDGIAAQGLQLDTTSPVTSPIASQVASPMASQVVYLIPPTVTPPPVISQIAPPAVSNILPGIEFMRHIIRPLSKLASGSQVQGAYGTEDRSVLGIHEDLSTGVTKQLAAEVEFPKRPITTKKVFAAPTKLSEGFNLRYQAMHGQSPTQSWGNQVNAQSNQYKQL